VPDRSSAVLLLVDVINDLDFPGNRRLLRRVGRLSATIASLKTRCRQHGIACVYVNDNRGKWRSDSDEVIAHCMRPGSPGRRMVERLRPEPDDYIVLKPKHSAFFATPLDALLSHLGAKSLIIAGLTTNACVLTTVIELFLRDYAVYVPVDCVEGLSERDHRSALQLMKRNFAADLRPSRKIKLRNRDVL